MSRNAPRMRKAKYSRPIISTDLWKDFKKKYPEYKSKSTTELNQLWDDIAETIRDETVHNPLGVKLGSYCGELKLQYLPYKFRAIDYTTSESIGQEVPFLNITSRGKVATLKWERRWAVKFNRMLQFFAFEPNRQMNKMAEKHILNNTDSVRVSRVTLGGNGGWRNKIKK